ncbi:hypothetical protein E2C01_043250 [Portunus trituberculatus]|uniref:Uncharacterized protein n=1 Tax=Portunus trituberculatus TaxID=210409 RepID=A0A5B7FX17_PORTR|nr:hypothetical protein [Portunus trituberculatus]
MSRSSRSKKDSLRSGVMLGSRGGERGFCRAKEKKGVLFFDIIKSCQCLSCAFMTLLDGDLATRDLACLVGDLACLLSDLACGVTSFPVWDLAWGSSELTWLVGDLGVITEGSCIVALRKGSVPVDRVALCWHSEIFKFSCVLSSAVPLSDSATYQNTSSIVALCKVSVVIEILALCWHSCKEEPSKPLMFSKVPVSVSATYQNTSSIVALCKLSVNPQHFPEFQHLAAFEPHTPAGSPQCTPAAHMCGYLLLLWRW